MSVIKGTLGFGVLLNRSWRLTEALVGPSWVDVPLTLKLTPLGALDLTSILASNNHKLHLFHGINSKAAITSCNVVEVFVQEL